MKKEILFICIVILFTQQLFSEINLETEHQLKFTFDGPDCIEIVDINKDGKKDIVACSKYEEMAVWYENLGSDNYIGHIICEKIGGISSVHAADFNLDGKYDFVVTCKVDSKVIIYENIAIDEYKPVIVESQANGTLICNVNDIDNDGDMDIVYGADGNELALYVNNGNMSFTKYVIPSLEAYGFRSIDFADINQDGLTDIVTATWTDGGIYTHINMGDYNFSTKLVHVSDLNKCAKAVDFDKDGDIDIIWCSYDAGIVGFLANDGTNKFSNTDLIKVPGAYSLSIADVDADGDNDIYVSGYDDNKVLWIENVGGGVFEKRAIFKYAVQSSCVFASDFDDDGDIDAVSANPGPVDTDLGGIVFHENNAAVFTNHNVNTSGFSAIDLVTGDFDNDGDVDVVGASYYDNNIRFYQAIKPNKFSNRVVIKNLKGLRKINASDFNRDGLLDLVSVSWSDNKVALHINQGNMQFKTILLDSFNRVNERNETKRRPCWCETVDLDKDGDLDIVVAYYGSNEVIWYKNMGGNKFTSIVITNKTVGIECVTVKDVDKDGDWDLVTASWLDDKVSWFENTGFNKYTERILAQDIDYASSVYCDDVDLDGDMDILATAFTGDELYWFENTGSKKFTKHLISDKVNGARNVISANLDNQGKPETICASWWGSDVKWFSNNSGTFSSSVVKSKLNRVNALQAVDMDKDGDLDIVTASAVDNKIAWYENKSVQIIPPVLLFPTENAIGIVQNTDLIWEKVLYTLKYKTQLSSDYEFSNIIMDTVQEFTSIRLSDNICNSNRVYYWRVMSYGQIDKSGWSEIRSFETGNKFSDISGLETPSEALINVNPNILVQSVRINAYMPNSGIAEINLVDVSGREVKEIYKGYMNQGENVFTLDKNEINQGMYFILLRTAYEQKAIKLIVQ